jgi:protein disulfide-isomerase
VFLKSRNLINHFLKQFKYMKPLTTALILLLATTFAAAQDAYTAEQEGWLVNIEKAYEESQKTGKPVMANFTGSDWCGWCKRLAAAVFVKPEFKKWADENVVLLELDFPRRKQLPENIRQQNYSLQQQFGVRGYPTIWVFDIEKEDGQFNITPIGKTGYRPSVQEFTSGVDQMLAKKER